MTYTIDVIVPMYNAAGHIEECLINIFASDYPNFRVTLVDDHSSDNTIARLADYPNARLIALDKNMGVSAARNRGIEETDGDVVVFVDSDVLIPDDLLTKVAEGFALTSSVALIQGRYEDRSYYQNLFSQYKHFVFSFRGYNPSPQGEQNIAYVHTACVAVRREVFSDVIFNEQLTRCEDLDFGRRCAHAGWKIRADPTLTVGHKKKYTFFSYTKYQFLSARDMAQNLLLKRRENELKRGTIVDQVHATEKQPLYKKLWFMRPFVSLGLLFILVAIALSRYELAVILFLALLGLSFICDISFRLYLYKYAPISISIAAWPLYFFDGAVTGMGAAFGILTFKRPK